MKNRIKNRYAVKEVPFYGTIVQLNKLKDYNYDNAQFNLEKYHISNNSKVIKTLNMITNRSHMYECHPLLKTRFRQDELPISF